MGLVGFLLVIVLCISFTLLFIWDLLWMYNYVIMDAWYKPSMTFGVWDVNLELNVKYSIENMFVKFLYVKKVWISLGKCIPHVRFSLIFRTLVYNIVLQIYVKLVVVYGQHPVVPAFIGGLLHWWSLSPTPRGYIILQNWPTIRISPTPGQGRRYPKDGVPD